MFNYTLSIVISVLSIRQAVFSTECFQQHVSYWLLHQFWLNPSQYHAIAKLPQTSLKQHPKHTSFSIVEPTYTSAMMPHYSSNFTNTEISRSLSLQLHPAKRCPFRQLETSNSTYFYPMELDQYKLSRTFTTCQTVPYVYSQYVDSGKTTKPKYGSETTLSSLSVMAYVWFYQLFHHSVEFF